MWLFAAAFLLGVVLIIIGCTTLALYYINQ